MRAELKEFETKMTKSVAAYEKELATVRAGRANPAILDRVTVEYYGTPTPLNQVAQISLPDARTILVQPWDASLLKEAERAILGSDIGITPLNDGKALRLNFRNLPRSVAVNCAARWKKWASLPKLPYGMFVVRQTTNAKS